MALTTVLVLVLLYNTHVRLLVDEGELPWLVDVPGTWPPYATPYENYPILYVAIFVLSGR